MADHLGRSTWQKGGPKNPSLEHSETLPFVDSIAIPQEKMMQYSADEQMRFTFRSWRGTAVQNIFSGTGGGGTTSDCLYSTHADSCGTGVKCDGCDLNGKVCNARSDMHTLQSHYNRNEPFSLFT